jgi:glycosyltransferase involved in cell wall biosynthesis
MFSLVVSTIGRTAELEKLLVSLDGQTYKQFEVIVVDQNPDDRLTPVLDAHPALQISHLRSGGGTSLGRNVGLSAAKGDLIGFPDDDCWYPPGLLAAIARWFESHPKCSGVFACLRDADNKRIGPRSEVSTRTCTRETLLCVGFTATGFLRREVAERIGPFNECLGPGAGTQYQSGEDVDYFHRVLALECEMRFEPSFTVYHPSLHDSARLRRTTYRYALGGGYVLRIHGYPAWYLLRHVVRSFGGAAVSLLKGDIENVRIYLLRAAGQLRGYFWGPRDLAHCTQRGPAT